MSGRCEDLSGLPNTYIEVGPAEPFRDECVARASRLWASGVQAELHVWPGAFHESDLTAPRAELTAAAQRARIAHTWRTRIPDYQNPWRRLSRRHRQGLGFVGQ